MSAVLKVKATIIIIIKNIQVWVYILQSYMWEIPYLLNALTGNNYMGSSPDCRVFVPIKIIIPVSHATFIIDAKAFQGS